MAFQSSGIFVNLPVKDLEKSKNFFQSVGFEFDPNFSDEKAACLVIGENICAMLLVEDFFKTFTKKEVVDSTQGTEVILALAVESREMVDELVEKALSNGGMPSNEPQDHGFMYYRSFQDVDGHLWEVSFMDMHAVEQEEAGA
ncbi:VOC family protein [Halobacillus massiliensis]|uniref:VOC family protein n=1 Tax=Halobacillus massiliensis TaxID=1926286 RepID=UPI0009E26000|nr:VOC family protein [Halobacillus massiliensis]